MTTPEKLHLLVVTTNYAETGGGVEGHLRSLLPLLAQRGVAVTIAYLGTPSPLRVLDGVRVLSLKRRFDFRGIIALPSPVEWLLFAHRVRTGRLDFDGRITHIATHTRFFPMSYLGVRLGRRLGVPVIHTEHGGGHVVTSSRVVGTMSRLVDLTMGRSVLRGATHVLTVSSASRAFVRSLAGVEAEVFHNGVDLAAWLAEPGATTLSRERSLVFVGRLVREKGWVTFLELCADMRERGYSGHIRILGDGPDLPLVRERVDAMGLQPVKVPGRVPPIAVREALRGAVYVNPTTAAEGFQLTLVEALAAGASVVSYDVGGTDELVARSVFDIAVAAKGDAIQLREAVWSALTKPPQDPPVEQLLEWDWDHVADKYVGILKRTGGSTSG